MQRLLVTGGLLARLRVGGTPLPASGTTSVTSPVTTVSVTINGIATTVPESYTVLQACKAARAHSLIPTLCHHPMLRPVGHCRLCLVEISDAAVPRQMAETIAKLKNTPAAGAVAASTDDPWSSDRALHPERFPGDHAPYFQLAACGVS